MDLHTTLYWIGILLIVIGIAGSVLPLLPGIPVVFVGGLLIAWSTSFQNIGFWTLFFLFILMCLGIWIDIIGTSLGAKKAGAGKLAATGALVGTVVGLFFGIIGILICPFVGAVIGEILSNKDIFQASRAGFGTWIGIILGSIMRFFICIVMTVIIILSL